MHIVQIRRHGADLGVVMEQMRTWLDHHRVEPRLFDVAFLLGEVRFRFQFKNASDVSGFASESCSLPAQAWVPSQPRPLAIS